MGLSLGDWRRRFREVDHCPWPGPRPLRPNDEPAWLCGRDDDKVKFRREVDGNRVVFLVGSSGVGKTSLLQLGLLPELRRSDYVVAMCRDWSGTTFGHPATFLAEQVARTVHEQDPSLPDDVTVIRELNARHGPRAVIVLDQFEELMRDEPQFATELFDILAQINRATEIKLVISLRSEHLHELRPFEHQIQSFSTSHYHLAEVGESHAEEIAEAGNKIGRKQRAIDVSAAGAVATLWRRARRANDARTRRSTPIGLLHLQALLYALHARTDGATVTSSELGDLRRELELTGDEEAMAHELFTRALGLAVEVKLERCRVVSEDLGVDRYLIEGTAATLLRSVRHLSSAGFKLVRDAEDLAEATIGDQLEVLRAGVAASHSRGGSESDGPLLEEQEAALFRVLLDALKLEDPSSAREPAIDFLATGREAIAIAADLATNLREGVARLGWAERLGSPDVSPFEADPKEVTQGPLMGTPPARALIEEVRRFAFALEWMRTSVICRVSTTSDGSTRVALVHDGFGQALDGWSREQAGQPAHALYGVTAPRGSEFVWPSDASVYRSEFDEAADGSPRVFVNLRWRGASVVKTAFRRVVFVSCDLRGSMFVSCRFEGVSFVNCLLDGVMFTDCTFIGSASTPPETWREEPTAFLVAGSTDKAAELSAYRPSPEDGLVQASLPFYPGIVAAPSDDVRVLGPERGSVVIVGGRISTLMVRGATFLRGGSLCLRETVGSGFDFVEHGRVQPGIAPEDVDQARVEISGSLLRHLTFTTAPHRSEADEVPRLVIDAHGSVLAQTWFGDDLEGTFDATQCIVVSLWNGADPGSFRASARDTSKYHGLVGVDVDDTCLPINEGERLRPVQPMYDARLDGRLLNLKPIGVAMDYRRDAAQEDVQARSSRLDA